MTRLATLNFLTALVAFFFSAQTTVDAFSPFSPVLTNHQQGVVSATPSSHSVAVLFSTKRDDDIPREEKDDEYTGSVDWDAEWKKVVEKEKSGQPMERPGKDFYKSEAEIAAIRAANKAKAEVNKISTKLPSAPSMNLSSFTGDWRFWIAILALISVGTAVLQAPSGYTPISSGDSYYI